nr:hypothetical protein [Nostoc sp. WHI]
MLLLKFYYFGYGERSLWYFIDVGESTFASYGTQTASKKTWI